MSVALAAGPLEAPTATGAPVPVPELLAIVALSLAMVAVMVRFSELMVTPRRRAEGEPLRPQGITAVHRWGLLYGLVWALLVVAFVRLLDRVGEPVTARTVGLLLLVALGWFALNAGWIALARSLLRSNARAAGQPDPFDPRAGAVPAGSWERQAGDPSAEEAAAGEDASDGLGAAEAGEPLRAQELPGVEDLPGGDEARAPEEQPAPRRPAWKRALSTAGMLAAVLAVAVVGEAIPALKNLEGVLARHQPAALAPVVALAVVGFILLVGGGVALALAQGRPLSRREIEDMERRRRQAMEAPAVYRASAYRVWGPAAGAAGSDEMSFSEMKAAFRERAFWTSPRWRRVFAMAAGAACLFVGIWGVVFVLAPAGLKLVVALAVLYAAVQVGRGFARA